MQAVTDSRVVPSLLLAVALTVIAPQVSAHTGVMATPVTLLDAFLHPFTGLDHLAALLATGLWSAQQSGRAQFLLPMIFLVAMAVAALAAAAGVTWPMAESAIALSLVALGAALVVRQVVATAAAGVIMALCAAGHGYAHGAELLLGSHALPLFAVLLIASALTIAAGFSLGVQMRKSGKRPLNAIGVALVTAGGLLLGA